MIPTWISLAVSLMALAGVIWSNVDAGRREQRAWGRARKLEAHAAFLKEQQEADDYIDHFRHDAEYWEERDQDWAKPMRRALNLVRLFGSESSAVAANRIVWAMMLKAEADEVERMKKKDPDGDWDSFPDWCKELGPAIDEYMTAVQRDLGLPETKSPDAD